MKRVWQAILCFFGKHIPYTFYEIASINGEIELERRTEICLACNKTKYYKEILH